MSNGQKPIYEIPQGDMRAIIVDGNVELLVNHSYEAAQAVFQQERRRLKITQFRAIFGNFRQIQRAWPKDGDATEAFRKLQLMKPKLAYQAVRNRYLRILREILPPAIDLVQHRQHFQNLMDFMESFLAYLIEAKGSDR